MYVVVCSYGTFRHQLYAKAADMETAKLLQKAAIGNKYHDAEVMSERDFRAQQQEARRGQADSARTARASS
jgi:hypothetical protein